MVHRLGLLLLLLALVLAAPLASAAPDAGEDPLPELSIDDVNVTEGDSGTVTASFTVTLSAASLLPVTVDFATANGSATAPGDYLPAGGALLFVPGQTTQSVSVTVNGDTLDEANETFLVNLSNAINATIDSGQGVGTIIDDDAPPSLSINDVSLTEGDPPPARKNFIFTVTLSSASGQTVTVHYATQNGTAIANEDYEQTNGTVTFVPGDTTEDVTTRVFRDTTPEPDETYFVNLSSPTNATIADGQGLGTIIM